MLAYVMNHYKAYLAMHVTALQLAPWLQACLKPVANNAWQCDVSSGLYVCLAMLVLF